MRKNDMFSEEVGKKESRKISARREKDRQSIWYGMGMFGLIGWSVTVPAIIGVATGIWIDRNWPGPYSWTLMLLIAGIIIGCMNAWYWLSREREEIGKETGNRRKGGRS